MKLSTGELQFLYTALTHEKRRINDKATSSDMSFNEYDKLLKTAIDIQAKINQERLKRAVKLNKLKRKVSPL